MRKLQIQEAQPIRIALEMADKSLKQAHRLLENVIVKVRELFLSADFVILDMGEDANDFLILRMPFLATGRNLIDVERGELVLRLREDYLVFKVFKPSPISGVGAPKTGESSSRKRKEKAPASSPYYFIRFFSKTHEDHFHEIVSKKKVIPEVCFDLKPNEYPEI
ncbi:uncharacterized protein LOC130979685 [Arachis stenosperma]|uniref:uncharacterized protein LOC130979685 n=1 Tax=Arachis stenosperma TaxID=217475 RepID=UPI0025AC6B80|nr:uncharacterized protein LOC130979685 [Arachis stenosperma]